MPNLTYEEKIVRDAPDTDPIEGHAVVIFEQVGEGREFRDVIHPGQRFQRKRGRLFSTPPIYVAYAVNMDSNLRLRFSDRFSHQDQVHSFDLTFTVDYRVSNPRTIAEKFSSDPLKRLQDEIKRVLGRAVSGLPWSEIKRSKTQNNFKDIEQTVLREREPESLASPSNLDYLRQFASELGLDVKRVELDGHLLEPDIEVEVAKDRAEREIQQRVIEHNVATHRTSLEQQTEDAELARRRHIEIEEKSHQRQLHAVDQQMKLGDIVIDNADVAMKRLAEDVSSAESFLRAGQAVQQTFSNMIQGSQRTPDFHALPPGSEPIAGYLSSSTSSAGKLLGEALEAVNQLHCPPDEKKRMLSALIHLIAELMLGEEGNDEVVKCYGEQVKSLSVELKQHMSPDQFRSLHRFFDYEALRQYLK